MTDNITVNKIELASALAHELLMLHFFHEIKIYEDDNAEVLEYTSIAQDIFDDYFVTYLETIENCEV
jgi:hypothetical protein